jgi:hypothetical protein
MPIWIFRRSTDDRLLVTAVQTGADPETFQDTSDWMQLAQLSQQIRDVSTV